MATPPYPTDGKPQNPVSSSVPEEAVTPMDNDQQDASKGAAKEPSIFVNTEPIREDQVQNAVKFLSHPKVKGSPVMYRRSFLERKGLTKEEIDEAFRRVPDDSPSISSTQPVDANQGVQSQAVSNIQPQAATQSLQPAVIGHGSKYGTRFHWSHAILAVGGLAISGAGTAIVFKNVVVPRLKSWIRKVVNENGEEDVTNNNNNKTNKKPTLGEEAAAAAKAAAAAASDVARASQEMLVSKTEEKKYFGELLSLLDMQVKEMKSMSNSIRKLEGQTNNSGREVQVTSSRPPYTNGRADYDLRSARSMSPPPATVEPPATPHHPKSYTEIMSMIQRGERPPNIREINDLPPNPDQPVSNPRLAPKPKPWEAVQSHASSAYTPYENNNGVNYFTQDNGSGSGPGPAPVYQSNGEGAAAPWWQQKNGLVKEVEPEENKTGYASERPVQRSLWVPPQPPPVAMAEAAAAIRQPKKSTYEKEQQLTDDQFLARSAQVTDDELQRVTNISESGGGAGSSIVTNTSEIQQEGESSYYEG